MLPLVPSFASYFNVKLFIPNLAIYDAPAVAGDIASIPFPFASIEVPAVICVVLLLSYHATNVYPSLAVAVSVTFCP